MKSAFIPSAKYAVPLLLAVLNWCVVHGAFGAPDCVDRIPPVLVSADFVDSNLVSAAFSEAVLASAATNLANYSLTNTLGGAAILIGVTLTNQTNVLLRTTALNSNFNYILKVISVPDVSPASNSILSLIPVARTLRVIAFNSAWDYYNPYPPVDNPDPGANWNNLGYDMSSRVWYSGSGAFGHGLEISESPVPVITDLGQSATHTIYFRNGFSLNVSRAGLTARLRYAVDDGALLYMNGRELLRVNMPHGGVSHSTFAADIVGLPVLSEAVVDPELLRAGTNLAAVELHQIQPIDVDNYLAAELTVRAESFLDGPLTVVGGPHTTTVEENQPATFRVMAVAASDFQWRLHGTNVPGATNATFTISPSLSMDGASVRVMCSGSGASVVSSGAVLRVLPDWSLPALVSAQFRSNDMVEVSFSEPVASASATNTANYSVNEAAGATVSVVGASLENDTNVVLFFASSLQGRYTVTVSNVTDRASSANAIVPGSSATVGARYVTGLEGPWKFLLINTNQTVHAAFSAFDYEDSAWRGPSNALLYANEAAVLPARKKTQMPRWTEDGTWIPTFYFRQRFVTPVTTSNAAVRVWNVVDDGVVLHLNGQEIYRFNMPTGTVTAESLAASTIGDADLVGPIDVVVTNLLCGTNVLAANLHPAGPASGDVVFGASLDIHFPSVVSVPGEARLTIVRTDGQLRLQWNRSDYSLEFADHVTGPWTRLNAGSPVFVPCANAVAFYRLQR